MSLDWMRRTSHAGEDEIELGDDEGRTDWLRFAIKEVNEFVTACFTEQACEGYIEANKHNLNKPFIFAASLYRNTEMIGLREFLLTQLEADTAP